MTGTSLQQLAVFDLDGTLLRRDSFLPFLISYGIKHRKPAALAATPFEVGAYAARMIPDYKAKERLLGWFFRNQPVETIDRHAEWFCRNWISRNLLPAGVDKLREHLDAGCRVILLSASPDLYVRAVGLHLGIAETVCTRVRSESGRCLGMLDGKNCKGESKLSMLREHLRIDQAPAQSFAYGDSKSDLPVLHWVKEGYLYSRGAFRRVRRSADAGVSDQRDRVGNQSSAS